MNDGSGLSHNNRFSARHVVTLVKTMPEKPEGFAWSQTFSIAGVRGTLSSRMTGSNTKGRFFGKTGTLDGVICTSGYLEHRHMGRRLLFGMLMNNVSNATAARSAHDNVIQAYAEDLLAAGSRPKLPEISSVRSTGGSITVRWKPSTGANGYLVWTSRDALVWKRSDAHRVAGTSHTIGGLSSDQRLYVRVVAFNHAGESDPSNTYASKVSVSAPPVLIVDGNERWQAQPVAENTMGAAHDFAAWVAQAIDGVAYDTVSNRVVTDGVVSLSDYKVVVWSLGEEGTAHHTLDSVEQQAVRNYLQGGGSLFISGAEIGFDLYANGDASSRSFYQDVLRAQYLADSAKTFVAKGSGGVLGEIGRIGFYTPDRMVVDYPDQIAPYGGSQGILRYEGGLGGTAAIQYQGGYRLVYFGFPFESIDSREDRRIVMSNVLGFLLP
jgi:hypothetical protein